VPSEELSGSRSSAPSPVDQEPHQDQLHQQRSRQECERALDDAVAAVVRAAGRAPEEDRHQSAQQQHGAEADQVQADDELLARGSHRRCHGLR
jgi:hypothetical protein